MAKTKSEKLTLKHLIGYGCGDMGGSITLYMVSGYMTRFLQVHLQMNAAILATMLLIWNVWDAVNDPLMGTLMDMAFNKAKPGSDKFRPWILRSLPLVVVGMVGLYMVPPMLGGGMAMVAAVFCLKIVYEFGYTMLNIGMGSLLGNMAKNDTERATLSSARGFGSTFASMVAGFVVPQVLSYYNESIEGYGMAAAATAVVAGVIIFAHYAFTEERNLNHEVVEKTPEQIEAEKIKLTDILTILRKNRAYLALIIHSIFSCIVIDLNWVAASYMYADVLHDIGIQSYASMLSSVTMIVILLGAPLLTKKWDLITIIRFTLVVGFAMYAGLLAYCLMTADINAMLFVVWNAIGNAMVTVSSSMQWGLVAESIDYNEYLTGKRNEGTIYGFFSFSRRLGSTIAGSLTVLLIAAIGYNPELTAAGLEQAAGTIAGIKLLVVGTPPLAALVSWICFTFIWNINGDVRQKMADWKAARTAK